MEWGYTHAMAHHGIVTYIYVAYASFLCLMQVAMYAYVHI